MQISNLLRYNINDTQVRMDITHATISANHNIPTHQSNTQQSYITQQSQHVRIEMDHTAFWASVGMRTIADYVRYAAQRGKQAAMEFSATRAANGEYLNHIEKGHTIAQLYRQKFLSQADTTLEVKRTDPVEITVIPGYSRTKFTPMQSDFTWDVQPAPRRYTPPDAGLTALNFPSVGYDYLGRPRLANPQSAQRMNLLV